MGHAYFPSEMIILLIYGNILQPKCLYCLEVVNKFVVLLGVGWVLKPILVFSFVQAEQYHHYIFISILYFNRNEIQDLGHNIISKLLIF